MDFAIHLIIISSSLYCSHSFWQLLCIRYFLLSFRHFFHCEHRPCFLLFNFPDPTETTGSDLKQETKIWAAFYFNYFLIVIEGCNSFWCFLRIKNWLVKVLFALFSYLSWRSRSAWFWGPCQLGGIIRSVCTGLRR